MGTGALIFVSPNIKNEQLGSEEVQSFLPMMYLDGTTVIKREIATLRRAGISPIMVACGEHQDILKNHLSHHAIVFCEDIQWPELEKDVLESSWKECLPVSCDRFLIIPAEYPVFSEDTVKRLMDCSCAAVPVYQGKVGFPRLCVADAAETNMLETQDEGVVLNVLEDGLPKIEEYAAQCRNSNELQFEIKLFLKKEQVFFNPDIYNLFMEIKEKGTIQAAAASVNMSYTKAWKMVNLVEKELGFPFLSRANGGKNGGGSFVTEEGKLFIDRYHAMVEDMKKISKRFFDIYFQDFQ